MLLTSPAFRAEWLGARRPPSACPTKRAVLLFRSSVSYGTLTGSTVASVANCWRTYTVSADWQQSVFEHFRHDGEIRYWAKICHVSSVETCSVSSRNGVTIACIKHVANSEKFYDAHLTYPETWLLTPRSCGHVLCFLSLILLLVTRCTLTSMTLEVANEQ